MTNKALIYNIIFPLYWETHHLIPRTYFSSIFANRNQVFEESSESLPYIVLFDGGNHFVFVLDSRVSTPGFCTFLN